MRTSVAIAFIALLGLAWPAHAAPAQKTTPTTTITQISVLTKSHAKYKRFHGAVWLDFDKQPYRWGGLYCGGKGLSELKVTMLFAAFRSKYSVNLEYVEYLYKGQRRNCVTGFTIRR